MTNTSADTPKKLRVVVTGGGSGGHVTPVLAVAHELKALQPDCEIFYINQKGDKLGDVPQQDGNIDAVYTVLAGKFRRYHGEGWKQLLDLPTIFKNIRDGIFVVVGILQSWRLLRRLKPDVIFTRGSFVSVPVCLAAAQLRIPFITHDSDAIPSLSNRLIARWAAKNAVALPKELYPYPADKAVTVGVPIFSHKFTVLSTEEKLAVRQRLGLGKYQQLIFVTGGGLGARRLNDAVIADAPELLKQFPGLAIVHVAGRGEQAEVDKKYNDSLGPADRSRVYVEGFVTNLNEYGGAADVIVTRAGGTTLAEWAAQAKPCVIVPNPELTGGHQTKNAQALADLEAAVVVEEPELAKDPAQLQNALVQLLNSPQQAEAMGKRLHTVARPDAAQLLAALLVSEAFARAGRSR